MDLPNKIKILFREIKSLNKTEYMICGNVRYINLFLSLNFFSIVFTYYQQFFYNFWSNQFSKYLIRIIYKIGNFL
jgi:hypothetical protein